MYVRVRIDVDDVLDELSDDDLREELASRMGRKGSGNMADYTIPIGVALDTMLAASDALRKAGRVDLAFKLDETRVDYIEPRQNQPQYYRFKSAPAKLQAN